MEGQIRQDDILTFWTAVDADGKAFLYDGEPYRNYRLRKWMVLLPEEQPMLGSRPTVAVNAGGRTWKDEAKKVRMTYCEYLRLKRIYMGGEGAPIPEEPSRVRRNGGDKLSPYERNLRGYGRSRGYVIDDLNMMITARPSVFRSKRFEQFMTDQGYMLIKDSDNG